MTPQKLSRRAVFSVFSFSTLTLPILVTSCQKPKVDSSVNGAVADTPFAKYCQNNGFTKCSSKANDIKVNQQQWEIGVDIFKELLNSPSRLSFTRDEFNLPSIQSIFTTFGASGLMSFVQRIPWQSMEARAGVVTLTSENPSQSLVVNGLKLIAAQQVTLTPGTGRSFVVTGFSISNAEGKNTETVKIIDLKDTGVMHITTNKQRITQFPISFFTIDGLVQKATLSATGVFNTIMNVALDSQLDWRKDANISLTHENIQNLMKSSDNLVVDTSVFGSTLNTVVSKSKYAIFGGSKTQVLSLGLQSPLACKMTFINIPIIGKIDINLNFGLGFGIDQITRLPSGVAQARIYGITTSMGAVENAQIEADSMKIKVGSLTIPLDFKQQVSGNGIQLKTINCGS